MYSIFLLFAITKSSQLSNLLVLMLKRFPPLTVVRGGIMHPGKLVIT
ncbi:hypothetical protein A359_00050 [secondary endosymbiont of Ctenarytaina eucalypti]|uniref:Uncharacterized protein n=1 Tax=secondary endosymbiont of Ctenarytaina eucalypti TaxID=1199245 RepID=J3Z2K5_9ENTR|nr:hypothetical protein A359_00050 [secondary endosymbiont of Ctenarytaina eucalypti]